MHATGAKQTGSLCVPLEEALQVADEAAQTQQELPKMPVGERAFLFSTEKSSLTALHLFQEIYFREGNKTPIEFVPIYDWSPSPVIASSGAASDKEVVAETEKRACPDVFCREKKSMSSFKVQEQGVDVKSLHSLLHSAPSAL